MVNFISHKDQAINTNVPFRSLTILDSR